MLWRLRNHVDICVTRITEYDGHFYFVIISLSFGSRSQMTAPSRHVPIFHYGIAGLAPVVFKPNDILH